MDKFKIKDKFVVSSLRTDAPTDKRYMDLVGKTGVISNPVIGVSRDRDHYEVRIDGYNYLAEKINTPDHHILYPDEMKRRNLDIDKDGNLQ